MSTQNSEPDLGTSSEAPVISKSLMMVAAAGLAVPALIPLLVLIEPRLVPFIPPVESNGLTTILFMVVLSLVLLAANWGFLFLCYRWINKYAEAE